MRAFVGWLMAFCLGSFAYALPIDNNTTQNTNKSQIIKSNTTQTNNKALAIKKLLDEKNRLDKKIFENNIWTKIYSNYHIYKELKNQSSKLYQDIIILQSKFDLSDEEKAKLKKLQEQQTIIQGKLQLLKEYEKDPFKKFITPPKIEEVPTVSNPLAVISAISYQKKLKSDQKEYEEKFASIEQLVHEIEQKKAILLKLTQLDLKNQTFKQELNRIQDKLDTFMPEFEIFKTTKNVYTKKIDEITLNLKQSIKREIQKALNIATIILVFIIFPFSLFIFS